MTEIHKESTQPPPPPPPKFILRPPIPSTSTPNSPRLHATEITCVRFIPPPSDSYLLAGDNNGYIHVFQLQTQRCLYSCRVFRDEELEKLSISRLEQVGIVGMEIIQLNSQFVLITQSRDDYLRCWDLNKLLITGELEYLYESMEKSTCSVGSLGFCALSVFVRDNNAVLAFPNMLDPAKFDLGYINNEKLSIRKECIEPDLVTGGKIGMLMCLRLFEVGGKVAGLAGFENGCVGVFVVKVDSGDVDVEWKGYLQVHSQPVTSIALTPYDPPTSTLVFYTTSAEPKLQRNNITITDTEITLTTISTQSIKSAGLNTVIPRRDSQILFTGGWDGKIRVWRNNDKTRPLAILRFHREAVACLDCGWTERGNWVVAGGRDGRISVWVIF